MSSFETNWKRSLLRLDTKATNLPLRCVLATRTLWLQQCVSCVLCRARCLVTGFARGVLARVVLLTPMTRWCDGAQVLSTMGFSQNAAIGVLILAVGVAVLGRFAGEVAVEGGAPGGTDGARPPAYVLGDTTYNVKKIEAPVATGFRLRAIEWVLTRSPVAPFAKRYLLNKNNIHMMRELASQVRAWGLCVGCVWGVCSWCSALVSSCMAAASPYVCWQCPASLYRRSCSFVACSMPRSLRACGRWTLPPHPLCTVRSDDSAHPRTKSTLRWRLKAQPSLTWCRRQACCLPRNIMLRRFDAHVPRVVWVCGCVSAWVCGCVGVWVCGCVGVVRRCSCGAGRVSLLCRGVAD